MNSVLSFVLLLEALFAQILTIEVEFNMLSGASRHPHCSYMHPLLQLPSTYATYTEFVSEFRKCTASEYSWIMDYI